MPKGSPQDAIDQLAGAIRDALQSTTVRDDLVSRGFFPNPSTPAQFKAQFLESQKLLGEVIKMRGIKIQ
jgi:tripartite-type tricarboxylate transporter receptor subunit TctC